MPPEHHIASAPGTIKVMGEHAVLQGHPAIACSLNCRLTITLIPRSDDIVSITSALGTHRTTLDHLAPAPHLSFMVACLRSMRPWLEHGCELHCASQINPQWGLGSSAAATVATLGALAAWRSLHWTPMQLIEHAIGVIRQVQGAGSGVDVAAAVHGGLVWYTPDPVTITALPMLPGITLVHAGHKTITQDAVAWVQRRMARLGDQLPSQLYDLIGACTRAGKQAILQAQWDTLGTLWNVHYGLQEALGVSTPDMRRIVSALQQHPDILGVKLSGAGLGDGVLGLGRLREPGDLHPLQPLAVQPDTQGLAYA